MAKLELNFESKWMKGRAVVLMVVAGWQNSRVAMVQSRGRGKPLEIPHYIFYSHFYINHHHHRHHHHLFDVSTHTHSALNQYQVFVIVAVVVFLVNYVRMTHHFYVIECAHTFSHRQQPSKKSFKRKWLFKWYTICIHDSYWYHCIPQFCLFPVSFAF